MEYIKDLIFDFLILCLYVILIINNTAIILHNVLKVCRSIYEIGEISCKNFFATLLSLFFGQLSSIILFNLIGTVARLYLERSMLFGIGFFFTESTALFKTDGVGVPIALLVFSVIISSFMNIVRQLKDGMIKWYMPFYILGIAAISCVFTVTLCYIMPQGIGSFVGMFYDANPFWSAFIVGGSVLVISDGMWRERRAEGEQEKGDTP